MTYQKKYRYSRTPPKVHEFLNHLKSLSRLNDLGLQIYRFGKNVEIKSYPSRQTSCFVIALEFTCEFKNCESKNIRLIEDLL